MGRIISPVTVKNPFQPDMLVVVNALVDTGASNMFLPDSLRGKLGEIEELSLHSVHLLTVLKHWQSDSDPSKYK